VFGFGTNEFEKYMFFQASVVPLDAETNQQKFEQTKVTGKPGKSFHPSNLAVINRFRSLLWGEKFLCLVVYTPENVCEIMAVFRLVHNYYFCDVVGA
jgi:hypothetical protein